MQVAKKALNWARYFEDPNKYAERAEKQRAVQRAPLERAAKLENDAYIKATKAEAALARIAQGKVSRNPKLANELNEVVNVLGEERATRVDLLNEMARWGERPTEDTQKIWDKLDREIAQAQNLRAKAAGW